MSKKEKLILWVYIAVGILLIAAGIAISAEYYSSLLVATGIGLSFSSILNLLRYFYHMRPENREAYEQKVKEQQIDIRDERKVYLRYKAGYHTMVATWAGCMIVSFVLAWMRGNSKLILLLFVFPVLQYLVANIIYKVLCKKM